MAYQNIIYEVSDNIAIITFNRPEAMNALNNQTRAEFGAAMADAGSDDSVRVIILTGSGKSFVAGSDIKELQQTTPLIAHDADAASLDRVVRTLTPHLNTLHVDLNGLDEQGRAGDGLKRGVGFANNVDVHGVDLDRFVAGGGEPVNELSGRRSVHRGLERAVGIRHGSGSRACAAAVHEENIQFVYAVAGGFVADVGAFPVVGAGVRAPGGLSCALPVGLHCAGGRTPVRVVRVAVVAFLGAADQSVAAHGRAHRGFSRVGI